MKAPSTQLRSMPKFCAWFFLFLNSLWSPFLKIKYGTHKVCAPRDGIHFMPQLYLYHIWEISQKPVSFEKCYIAYSRDSKFGKQVSLRKSKSLMALFVDFSGLVENKSCICRAACSNSSAAFFWQFWREKIILRIPKHNSIYYFKSICSWHIFEFFFKC